MEPPKGFWATLWTFLCFLPYFLGLLLLGIIKGVLLCPLVCLIMTTGISALILGLWPVHAIWTIYCVVRTKQLGPILKLLLCIGVSVILVLWPLVGILGSIIIGAGFGFLVPLMATFEAIGEGKTNEFIHCILDGTWSTIKGSFTVVRDFKDICFHTYFSFMDDLRLHEPPNGKPHEIRLLYIPGSLLVGVLGIIVDTPVITLIALCKSPCMLFKGWHRLFHDLIGREGPFLETACVPFAGLAIILWPTAVAGAVVASILSSLILGAYAAVVSYQESSVHMALAYIISSLSMFDEYSNDVLDMPEGSCFPRYQYRKKVTLRTGSLSRPTSLRREKQDVKNPPSRSMSFKNVILELKPIKLLEHLFAECKLHSETLVAEGIITKKDIEESKSGKGGSRVMSIGLPAYCILQALLRSVKANSDGLLLSDNTTEITTMNRPKDTFFDWFFEPLMIIKEQIKAENFSEAEENYLCKLVLLIGDPKRVNEFDAGSLVQNGRRGAEINALARRLQGITKSISRYPTCKRRFDDLVSSFSEELESTMGGNKSIQRLRSGLTRLISQKSLGSESTQVIDQESQVAPTKAH